MSFNIIYILYNTKIIYIYTILKHQVDSMYMVKCLRPKPNKGLAYFFQFTTHNHSDSEFFLNEGIKQTPQQPAYGERGVRDEHKAFFLEMLP